MLSESNYNELKKYLEPHTPSKEEYERFVELKRQNFIKLNSWKSINLPPHGEVMTPDTWIITTTGKDELSKYESEAQDKSQQSEFFKAIADSAMKQAAIAEAEAKDAKKDALFSKIISVVSLAISLASILIPFLSSAAG